MEGRKEGRTPRKGRRNEGSHGEIKGMIKVKKRQGKEERNERRKERRKKGRYEDHKLGRNEGVINGRKKRRTDAKEGRKE